MRLAYELSNSHCESCVRFMNLLFAVQMLLAPSSILSSQPLEVQSVYANPRAMPTVSTGVWMLRELAVQIACRL